MAYPVGPATRRARSGPDLAVSIAALALTLILGIAAAVFGMFSLAFLDNCPAPTCNADDAFTAVATALAIAVAIGAVGLSATIVRLYRRRTAWPFAVATLSLCVIAFFSGGVGYALAVGA